MIKWFTMYVTFTFNHLADAFTQSDLQMRTIEAIKQTTEQKYVSAVMLQGFYNKYKTIKVDGID